MLRRLAEKFHAFRHAEQRDRFSIVIPFLIISAGLGVLAWRSYVLSVRMERGATLLAERYAGYASEVTARRVDAAVQAELARASDEWQQMERRLDSPTFQALQEWIVRSEWIVSAMYIPDYDPANVLYVNEVPERGSKPAPRLSREFFTSGGTVRFQYDPLRLLSRVSAAVRQPPPDPEKDGDGTLQPRADVSLVSGMGGPRVAKLDDGFAVVAPLAAPLSSYGVRAVVRTSYIGSAWQNQRLISLSVSFVALALTAAGAYLALRGLRKESETMKLRGALIANVSHELRTPLSMIRLGAETLQRATRLTPAERKDLEDQILREVLHLSHLVENVLDVARMQHPEAKALAFTPVRPRELITTLVNTYRSWIESRGFTISVSLEEGIGEQLWDRESVSRALLNLIDNAIKYSGDEKSIAVTLRQTDHDVVIEVTDRGIGIEAKDLSKIFDPYYRAQFSDTQTRRGAGLGLTLVQQIVASHGGRVEVDSQPGAGSTFRLLFPQVPAPADERVSRFAAREAF
ncbi:MAG TPA: HAMP domain-containing sensor histidine kinase [Thermoanaerobaculia bacterium]|nr:HAMP domain-containing sensor histidine kinase [Thermoanaerobaculia bacterium]